jgi:hypothetical protein
MRRKFLFILFFLNLYQIKNIDCACAPPDPPAPCFPQEKFDEIFANESVHYDLTEQILKNSMNVSGFLLEEEDPVYHHFKTRDIADIVIQQNRFTTIMISTLQALKASGNYTKQQLRMCLKNVTLPANLPNVTLNCDPASTK